MKKRQKRSRASLPQSVPEVGSKGLEVCREIGISEQALAEHSDQESRPPMSAQLSPLFFFSSVFFSRPPFPLPWDALEGLRCSVLVHSSRRSAGNARRDALPQVVAVTACFASRAKVQNPR